jgi:hypothetical protein
MPEKAQQNAQSVINAAQMANRQKSAESTAETMLKPTPMMNSKSIAAHEIDTRVRSPLGPAF